MHRHLLTIANVREVLPPLQGLFGLLFFNPGRCPGLSSVGLTALADEIAETAEFSSFGTNDLKQTALGMSRDDSGSFLPGYAELEIVKQKSLWTATLRHN